MVPVGARLGAGVIQARAALLSSSVCIGTWRERWRLGGKKGARVRRGPGEGGRPFQKVPLVGMEAGGGESWGSPGAGVRQQTPPALGSTGHTQLGWALAFLNPVHSPIFA